MDQVLTSQGDDFHHIIVMNGRVSPLARIPVLLDNFNEVKKRRDPDGSLRSICPDF
jgi:hypothetical protein